MTPSSNDPRQILDQSPMTVAQIIVVAITVFLNALDGFDLLSISFASPGISAEWNVAPTALGIVLSMELIGMALGSIFLGGVADKIGRRPTIIGCLIVMAIGMLGATTASGPAILSVWRVFTGLGIGGMLSATNAVVAEVANKRWRNICISIMVIGYPLGGTFGGMIASRLLAAYSYDPPLAWRSVFYFGASVTIAMLPVLYFFMPESLHWLARKQPAGVLDKVNHVMRKLGHAAVTSVPAVQESEAKKSVANIFSASFLPITVITTAAYFFHILTFYFIIKWVPKIVVGFDFAPSSAGQVLTWANFGGALGGAVFGLLATRIGLKPLTIVIMAINAGAVAYFGRTPADLSTMAWLAGFAGFWGNAGISGMYSIVATSFPTHVRATGTGFVIGVGRGGAMLSPILAGYLLESGLALPSVAMVMGIGSAVAAAVLLFLKLNPDKAQVEPEKRVGGMPAPSRA